MEKTVKEFTKEEVNEIRELQQKVVTVTARIGEIELNIQELEETFQSLKNEKAILINSYNEIRVQEGDLGTKLRDKYGEGTYDINTNQFTPTK